MAKRTIGLCGSRCIRRRPVRMSLPPQAARRSRRGGRAIRSHEYCSATSRAPAPERRAPRLVLEKLHDRPRHRRDVAGRDEHRTRLVGNRRIALDVGCHRGRRRREGAREHHPEALAPQSRSGQQARRLELGASGRPPTARRGDRPVKGEPLPPREPAHGQRIGADDAKARAESEPAPPATRAEEPPGPCAARCGR